MGPSQSLAASQRPDSRRDDRGGAPRRVSHLRLWRSCRRPADPGCIQREMGRPTAPAVSLRLSATRGGGGIGARVRTAAWVGRHALAPDAPRADRSSRRPRLLVPMNVVVVAWCPFQARTSALARELGTEPHYVDDAPLGRSLPLTPLRYLARGLHMWRLLQRTDPRTLIVITAPVFAPLVGWLWCALHRRQLVVDCHPGVLHFRRWRWALPIHRRLFRHAGLVLVHTPDDERLVNSWGAPALFLPDDLALQSQALPMPRHTTTPSIVVAGTFDPDEPISALLAAAALVPDMELRLTGDPERLPAALRSSAPKNVTFLGYLAYDRFLGEMLAADAVAVFTTDPHVMSRAGQDAIGLGRPLVSSDRPWLRSRFAETAVLCET